LELLFNNQLVESRSVTLKPRETVPQVFVTAQALNGIFTVRITAKDDLAADNQASIISLLPEPMKVLLITAGNNLLAKALRAVPEVELTINDTLSDSAKGAFDLVVLDNVTPEVWPAPNVLAFHVVNTNLFAGWSVVQSPPIVGWKGTHPLLRFVSFDNVAVVDSYGVKAPPWATTVVESPQVPLILAGELNRQRIAWVGFDALNSTWPLRVSFPIFVENAVEWLNPASANAALLTVRAGDPFRFLLPDVMTKPQLIPPDGLARPIKLDPNSRELVFGDTTRQGIYRIQSGTNEISFCVNVLDALESDTTPRGEITLGKYTKVKAATQSRASLEVWRWFALAALAMTMIEWWYYHRRTA
jgi:hypothetical protein